MHGEDGLEGPVRPDGLGEKGGLGRQALVEVSDLYFPFRMCYWFNLCDVSAVVPEPITHVGVCCYDHAVHVDIFTHQTFTG